MSMTETQQTVTDLRKEFDQFLEKVYQAKSQVGGLQRIKRKRWFNNGIADLETGLASIEKAFLTPSKSRRKESQSEHRPASASNGGDYRRA